MEKKTALELAESKLEFIIKNQPNLLADAHAIANNRGALLADFCHNFMEQYAKRLVERKD